MPNKHPRKTLLVNTLGTLGYVSCLFQWLWAVVVFLPTFMESDLGTWVVPQDSGQTTPAFKIEQPPLIMTIFVIGVTALLLIVTVIALLRLPAQVARAGKKVTHVPAEALLPVITHHKKISATKKRELSAQLIRIIKLCLCIFPFIAASFAFLLNIEISYEIVIIVAATMASISLLWFALQYLLARLWKIPEDGIV